MVALVERAAGDDLAAVELEHEALDRRDRSAKTERRRRSGEEVPLDPPLRYGRRGKFRQRRRQARGEHDRAGMHIAVRRAYRRDASAGRGDAEHLDTGRHGAGASRERRRQPQGVHPPLLANAQGAGNVAQLRLDRVGALRIQDVDECAELGVERQCLRQRDEPFERLDADRAVPLGVEGTQKLQARAGQGDERRRVGPDVRLGSEQRRRAPRRPRREVLAFDHHDATQAGAGAEGGARHTDGAAADDEHVGTAVEVRRDAGLEGREHSGAGGVAPNGLADGHAERLRGRSCGGRCRHEQRSGEQQEERGVDDQARDQRRRLDDVGLGVQHGESPDVEDDEQQR